MRKSLIILVNAVLIIGMLIFVMMYARFETNNNYQLQRKAFEETDVAMERVTENYLQGEQRICDVWTRYIDKNPMTMEEASAFIRVSHVLPDTSAHIIDTHSRTGLSTRPNLGTTDDYAVSYEQIDLLGDLSWIAPVGDAINITRAYTNPVNGEPSLAFCNRVTLLGDDGAAIDALLMRVVPMDELEGRWIFPQEHFKTAEYSIIDTQGNYIIKGNSFKGTSFF